MNEQRKLELTDEDRARIDNLIGLLLGIVGFIAIVFFMAWLGIEL